MLKTFKKEKSLSRRLFWMNKSNVSMKNASNSD